MQLVLFCCLFLSQLFSGYPFLLLFLFWNNLFTLTLERFILSLFVGIAFGMMFGNAWYWILLTLGTTILLQLLNRYTIRRKTPLALSLLLLFVVIFWHVFGPVLLLNHIITMYFLFAFLFFLVYAFWTSKILSFQKRLF